MKKFEKIVEFLVALASVLKGVTSSIELINTTIDKVKDIKNNNKTNSTETKKD